MRLWGKAHHIGAVACALAIAVVAELVLGESATGIPAFVYTSTNLVLSLMAAMPLIVAISVVFDGNESVGIPVRNTGLYDTVAFFGIAGILFLVGALAMPMIGYSGICTALTVLGCGALGIVCSRLFGRKTGGAAGPVYIVLCCLVGTPPMRQPLPWQFPLATMPMPSHILLVLLFVMMMSVIRAHPERRIA